MESLVGIAWIGWFGQMIAWLGALVAVIVAVVNYRNQTRLKQAEWLK